MSHAPGTTTPPTTEPASRVPVTGARPSWLHPVIARPGPARSLLFVAGAVLLAVSGVIHLHLWSTGYRSIATIGPLFLLQGIAGLAVAVAVAVTRHWLVAAGAALFAAGTIAGLLLSVEVGLFGFKDSLSAPYAATSLTVEIAAVVVLAVASVVSPGRPRRRH